MDAEEGEDGTAAVGAFLHFSPQVGPQEAARKNRPTRYARSPPVRISTEVPRAQPR